MRRLLALDTATWWGSVAAVEGQGTGKPARVVHELGGRVHDSHAEHLLAWIARLLDEIGWSRTTLDGYAATRGPGSFTGIRVGLGTMLGLGLAADRPCFGVTTLEAIVEAHGPCATERVPLLDAGRGEVYGARYDPEASPPALLDGPWLLPRTELRRKAAGATWIAGPGTEAVAGEGESAEPLVLRRAPERLAHAVGRIALAREGESAPLRPLYVREPDALLRPRR